MKTAMYTYRNPIWLVDRFIFKEHPKLGTVYVKVNQRNKIEEIGIDIEGRTSVSMENIMKSKLLSESTKLERSILNRIDDIVFEHCMFRGQSVWKVSDENVLKIPSGTTVQIGYKPFQVGK